MENITIILDEKPINYNKLDDLWETIAKYSDNVVFSCAGTGKCGKCKIKILNNAPKPTEDERNLLTPEEIEQNIRLACLIDAKDGLELETINKSRDNLKIATGSDEITVSNALFEDFGIAIDIGTTTLVASLYGKDGQIAKVSRKNPQVKYGTDVISRIEIHLKDREILKNLIVNSLNEMIAEICADIKLQDVNSAVITGNTTMLYILTGRDVSSLATAPFEADFLFDDMVTAKSLGLICENSMVYFPKCIAAFVGADISTAILASNMTEKNQVSMLIDIGTNGEMAIVKDNTLICCATAAGPAFEGGEISQGMSAVSGAISSAKIENGTFAIKVIEGVKPIGICGSGLIDIVSALLEVEAIDETGTLDEDILEELGMLYYVDDKLAVKIADGVYLTGADVRKIQLAKGAISAGAKTIIETNGLEMESIDKIYIAGGFGSFLDIKSACSIGLLPKIQLEKYEIIGNAALDGAARILCDKTKIGFPFNNIITTGIDLSRKPEFTNNFMECMMFM